MLQVCVWTSVHVALVYTGAEELHMTECQLAHGMLFADFSL